MIEAGPRDRVLHLGCGDGAVTCGLARQAHEGLAVGVDPSEDNVGQARRLAADIDNVMFVPGSPEQIPWQENFFTVILCEAPAEQGARAAREMFRVLAPGGRLYLAGPADPWAALLEAAGFEEIAVRETSLLEALKAGPGRSDLRVL